MRLRATLLALLCSTSFASAADLMYRKAPDVAPAPAYTQWNDFYIGVHGGYGWGNTVPAVARDFTGGFGGAQIGYNFQIAPGFVLGIEADAAGGDIGRSAGFITQSVFALGTVRGRAGVAFDNVLIYGTGGFAWAANEFTVAGASASRTHAGWTAGGGVEWAFAPNWSAKAEYLYARFGSESYFGQQSGELDLHTVKMGINYRFGWEGPVVARY